jgi:hypothetical protein
MLLANGCTQTAQQQKAPAAVTATQTDNSRILITYSGSTDMTTLLELEVTVSDSAGKIQTKSVGDRFSTTPLKYGATLPLTGTFSGDDHVLVTGFFMDSSKKVVLDTII